MAPTAIVLGTCIMGACFILDVIGISTDYWFVVAGSILHYGLFKACISGTCVSYLEYENAVSNIHYFGPTVCSCLCCFLLFVCGLIGLCGCNRPNPKQLAQNVGAVGIAAGVFGTIGFVWYYLYFFEGLFQENIIFSKVGGPGWSFYLSAVASGVALMSAITLIIIGSNIPSEGGIVYPNPQTMIAMNSQQSSAYPSGPPQQMHNYNI